MPAHANISHPPHQQHLQASLSPLYYIPLPERLIRDMGRNRLAVGLYALIGRLWRAQADADGWVALSDRDIALFDPALTRGPIRRALAKLLRYHWIQTEKSGYKKRFRPTWGTVRGSIQPWSATASLLGRPKHIKTFRLDQQLLDVYIGRLSLRQTEPVIVDRYVEPMLGLEDVGAYASTLAGYPQLTTPLLRLGLVVDDCVVAVPAISTILGQAAEVTKRGIQRLGWAAVSDPQPPPAPDARRPVFFVAAPMAATLVRSMAHTMADCSSRQHGQNIPTVRGESSLATATTNMTWMTWSTCKSWITPQTPQPGLRGGMVQGKNEQPNQEPNKAQRSEPEPCRRRSTSQTGTIDIKTETEQLLIDAGVWSRTARTLREAPLPAVRYALEQARTAQARDVAAYAVGLLGTLRDRQWQLPSPKPTGLLDPATYATDAYRGFLRDPGAAVSDAPVIASPVAPVSAALPAQAIDTPVSADLTPQAIWQSVQAELRGQMTPATYQATIAQAHLAQITGAVVVLAAPTTTVRGAMIEQCLAFLKRAFARSLDVPTVQLVIQLGVPSPPVRPLGARPQRAETVAPAMRDALPLAASVAPPPAAADVSVAVTELPTSLAALLPALQQQLRHRAAQRQERALTVLASAIQGVTVERETGDGFIELTPAVPTDYWRPEGGDLVVVHIGQSSYLEEVVKAQCALIAEELGSLVDRRLGAEDIVVRQSARGRPGRNSGRT